MGILSSKQMRIYQSKCNEGITKSLYCLIYKLVHVQNVYIKVFVNGLITSGFCFVSYHRSSTSHLRETTGTHNTWENKLKLSFRFLFCAFSSKFINAL